MASYETIVAATDLSDPSLAALQRAGELAERLGSRLIAIYVVEDRLPPLVLAHPSIEELLDEHRARADRALDETVARELPGRDVETVVAQGSPHEEIVRVAREQRASMIVVGMHGHGFLAHALEGSTAERVLHHAPCAVLVVPEAFKQ